MEKNQINNSIIEGWVGRLLDEHGACSLADLPIEVLETEISQVKGTIANCKVWDDPEGVALNEKYRDLLEAALDKKKLMALREYIARQVREKMTEYSVEITETFQKIVNVKAGSEADALEIVRRKYFEDEVFLTVDDDFVGTDFKVTGEVKC